MTTGDVRMKNGNTADRRVFGSNEDVTTIWLCLLTVFITLWL
jgi:hypothetical protein